ncbi:MAG: hypothetical protein II457_01645, partial [Paludibacteraceae bacterium]|nr:hypothetical protein [Paludibacteraceae bacterium]
MKKGFVTVLLVCLAVSAFAVELLPKQGLGIQVGWAQPILRLNSPNNPSNAKDSLSIKIAMKGVKIGVVYDGSIIAGFGTSIGLNYTFAAYNSGWKADNMYGMDYPRRRQMLTYHELELCVDWQYKFEVAKETYLIVYSGPTIQCGLAFDMRSDFQKDFDNEVEVKRYSGYHMEEGDNENEHLSRLNITWGVGAGFQYKRYF